MSQDVLMPIHPIKIDFKNKIIKNAIVFGLASILLTAISFFFIFGKGGAKLLIDNTLQRKQVIARAGATSMGSFFELVGGSMTFLARQESVISMSQENEVLLDDYIDSWINTPLAGVVLVDSEGVVRFDSNPERVRTTGDSWSDRDYFAWAKDAKLGEYRVFEPVVSRGGITEGTMIAPIATPVFTDDGDFGGALVGSIPISRLVEYFTDHLEIDDSTRAYLVDERGLVITSSIKELVGVNFLEVIKQSNFSGRDSVIATIEGELGKRQEGTMDVVLPDSENGGRLERFLIAHSPLNLHEHVWHLVVVTPAKDALAYAYPLYTKQIMMLLIVFAIFTLFVIRISKIVGYSEGASSEHKIHKGRE